MDWNSGLTRDGQINNGVVMLGGTGGGGAETIAEELQGYLQGVDDAYQFLVQIAAAQQQAAQNQNAPPAPNVSNVPLSTRQAPILSPNVLAPLDSAAITALQQINPTSISEDKEYAARGYENPDGTYSVTDFNRGNQASSTPPPISSLPAGATNAARLHTHGGNDPLYDNEHFSPADMRNARNEGVPSYLATPSGTIQRYDPSTNRVTVIYSPGGQQ
jgi:hypothetical protein